MYVTLYDTNDEHLIPSEVGSHDLYFIPEANFIVIGTYVTTVDISLHFKTCVISWCSVCFWCTDSIILDFELPWCHLLFIKIHFSLQLALANIFLLRYIFLSALYLSFLLHRLYEAWSGYLRSHSQTLSFSTVFLCTKITLLLARTSHCPVAECIKELYMIVIFSKIFSFAVLCNRLEKN